MLFEIPQAVPHFTDNNTKVQGGLVTSSNSLFYLCRSEVRSISCVRLFATPWTAALQASLSITNSQSLLKLKSIESMMPSNHLILCCPLFLLPSIFPSIKVFSNESVLPIVWPSIGASASASVLPMHIQG